MHRLALLSCVSCVLACAQSQVAKSGRDAGSVGGDFVEQVDGGDDLGGGGNSPDLRGSGSLGGGGGDLATQSAPSCLPRINEVATGTTTSGYQEFIELYNPCSGSVDVSGMTLVYRAAAGSSDSVLIANVGASTATMPAGGFLLFGGKGYYTSTRDGELASGIAAAGGGVGLRDSGGTLVDSVGWGTATNALVAGYAVAAPGDKAAPGYSAARSVDGQDSGDNASDFAVTTKPTPRAANVIQ